jgi:hypothetical protein
MTDSDIFLKSIKGLGGFDSFTAVLHELPPSSSPNPSPSSHKLKKAVKLVNKINSVMEDYDMEVEAKAVVERSVNVVTPPVDGRHKSQADMSIREKMQESGITLSQKELDELVAKMVVPESILKKAYFETDNLQEIFIYNSMRENRKFLRTIHTNFTPNFVEYLVRKTQLNEVMGVGVKGQVRGGKSTFALSIACFLSALRGRKFDINSVCASEFEFLEKVKTAEFGQIFLIDESKLGVFGVGSVAKRMKLKDLANIIAIKNISTIYCSPREFNSENADYGFHILGRARTSKPRMIRALMYNLAERGVGTYVPYGLVSLPIFKDIFDYGDELDEAYHEKKLEWVEQEQKSEGSIMRDIQLNMAKELLKHPEIVRATKRKERFILAMGFLPDDYTSQEKEIIIQMTFMLESSLLQ